MKLNWGTTKLASSKKNDNDQIQVTHVDEVDGVDGDQTAEKGVDEGDRVDGDQTAEKDVDEMETELEVSNKSKGDISLVPDEVSNRKENRAKRKLSQMSKILVSAYEDRKVEVEDEVTALEKNITSYLFAGIGDEWSVVFSIEGKIDVTRVLMESMRPGQYIHINVVLAWGHLLNHEEMVK
ncbi:hypothetical protein QVD17_39526 [Tagetes erecta]|uniref:Uncharacterized protein n=1 Tax=Tagetes erecta TaxID=13708 RepID=A0AAD8NFC8_TARER|nr:hypothetical protein QVD17_39526 [Tagetes erecta]